MALVQQPVFSLSIGGIELQTHMTIEQVFSRLQQAFLTPPPASDVVVMLTNDRTQYRYVGCIRVATFQAKITTLAAMKRYFCHASHGQLLIACSHQNDESFSAAEPLLEPCNHGGCSVI